jgi:hypothetical protein
MVHIDCLSRWCSAAAGERQVSPENPNILQTPCPTCKIFMNCPGSRDDIESRRKQNRAIRTEELFQEFQQQELAAQNRIRQGQPAAPQVPLQTAIDAITAAEAHIVVNIGPNIRNYNHLSQPSCLRQIETEIESYYYSSTSIHLDTYTANRSIRRALREAKTRIVNAIAEYCVEHILIPQMEDRFNTVAQGQTIEEISIRLSSGDYDSSLVDAYQIHNMLELYRINISIGVTRWWHLRNQELLERIMDDFSSILGEFVVLSDERGENVRRIGDFYFGNVDNMYLCNFFDINEDNVEQAGDVDDLIDSFEHEINTRSYNSNYQSLFDQDGQLQLYNAVGGTDAEHREIIEKIGTRIIKSNNDGEYPSHIDMNGDLGVNVYIGTNRSDEDDIIDRIWAIYGPGGVYSANNNGTALLRSREEVNNPSTGRSRSRSRSRSTGRSRSGSTGRSRSRSTGRNRSGSR